MSLQYKEINQITTTATTVLGADKFEIEQGGESKQVSGSVVSAALGFPVGGVCEWYTDTPPENCIFAQGQAIMRSTYSVLFALWGTSFGVGDGTNTFNVIDKREVCGVGIGTNATVVMSAHDVFATLGEYKDDRMQGHYHSSGTLAFAVGTGYTGGAITNAAPAAYTGAYTGGMSGNVGAPNNDGMDGTPRTGTTTRGKSIGCHFIIKYQ